MSVPTSMDAPKIKKKKNYLQFLRKTLESLDHSELRTPLLFLFFLCRVTFEEFGNPVVRVCLCASGRTALFGN